MTTTTGTAPKVPVPRWVVRTIWRAHRLLVHLTGGRLGLSAPADGKAGLMRVHAIGRTSGNVRPVIVCYFEDGGDLVTLAMNGWAAPDPGWWLNLQKHPDVRVDLGRRRRQVHARAAEGEHRARLWARFADISGWGDVEQLSALRPGGTAVVVLEPRPAPPGTCWSSALPSAALRSSGSH